MLYGYGGNILRIDLTTGSITTEPTDPKLAEKFLGGRGFGIYFLFTEMPRGADPLGPDNLLIFSPGPLSGTLVPGAGKLDITCKSPLTGGYAGSNVGGILTAEIKYAGYDSIILKGKAPKPVYIFIDNDKVEIRDASDLWGKGSLETEKILKDRLGEEFQIATIGPGGENGVKYACITTDYGRQAGRGGVGTVMGSKNVKAVAVRGNKSIPVADVQAFRRAARAMYKACKDSPGLQVWQRYGTAGVTVWSNEIGAFPTRNFSSGQLEGYENLSGEVMREKIVITDKGCFGCPSPCGKWSHVKKYGVRVEGPEYESTALLGGDCALTDIEDVAYANYLADDLGLDSISAGNVIAFAMECYERGILTDKDTDGIKLTFGNAEAVFAMLKKIAYREGIGAVLAEGVKHASQVFNKGSETFAIQAKGMEFSGYESHNAPSMLLSYMTCDVGAHHNRSWAITYDIQTGRDTVTPDKAERVIYLQHVRPLFDALGACRLQWVELSLDLNLYVPTIAALTGLERSWDDLLKVSERIWNLTRLFWFREVPGFGRAWDMPPARFYKEPVVSGPTKGKVMALEDVERLLDMYYEKRGWDANGRPSPQKLEELGLTEFAAAV
ncbi:MAG: aldehyde ferredoxin oxidoreductase family protein [Anaerolineae bacterium]|nr:aldehyde ferredoxin oxidoreductase family protein [Anaerolineae bacterium]